MASIFGHIPSVGSPSIGKGPGGGPGVVQSVGPSAPVFGGGFPGVYPASGPGQSGEAGIQDLQNPYNCKPEDFKTGRCIKGPPSQFLGKKKPGWR